MARLLLILALTLGLTACEWPPQAHAQSTTGRSPSHTYSGHGRHTCDTGSAGTKITGILAGPSVLGATGRRRVNETYLFNPTATVVSVLSNNGAVVVADGIPICNVATTCIAEPLRLDVPAETLSCVTAAGSAQIHVWGWQ